MAVMTTQNPESVLLEERSLKAAPLLDRDVRNGSVEVNGHNSPDKDQTEPITDGISNKKDDDKADQNQQAFSSNQTVSADLKGTEEESNHVESKPSLDNGVEQAQPEDEKATVDDAEMTDAPAPLKSPVSPVEKESQEVSTEAPEAPKLAIPSEPQSRPVPNSPASSAISPGTKEDVEMGDAPTQEASSAIEPGQNTQDTAISDAPLTPADDENSQTAAQSILAADRPVASPAAPVTADTSMSEPSQTATKVSRERDIDSEDEPVAKRAKVESPSDQVDVKKTTPSQDRMDVDQSDAKKPSLFLANGEPKNLADESLNTHPITDYMNKQLRNILAGVKKTKAGGQFRLPVQQLWPGLWGDYSAKIKNPTDISTMEKHLRGDLPRYANVAEFKSDLDLLVQNSITFNGEGHEVTRQARSTRETILARMAAHNAAEPPRPEKKETVKQHPSRHTEPRTVAQPPPAAAPPRPPKVAAPSPAPKPVVESPAFAIPASNNGVPLIRRDSTKPDSRTKRPVKPAHPKDLVYDTKRKKKLSPELRFCEEVLNELRKGKYYDLNAPFMQPVDPVALNIPSYHKIVKKPMDLSTMVSKLSGGEYTNAKEFERDFDLIVKNCRLFNGEDHVIYSQAVRLQQLFKKEFSRKDDWIAKHAPAVAAPPSHTTASPVPKDESDDEDRESEAEPEADEETKSSQHRLATIQKRLEEEQKKVNDLINAGTAEMADVDIAQLMVNTLQKQLMAERAKLAQLQTKKPAKSKPSKAKKAGGAGGGRKSDLHAAQVGGGKPKKSSGPKRPPKRKIGTVEKEIIAAGIGELDGKELERAIDIIKKDTGQGENDSGELELDIEQLSDEALGRLYDIAVKNFPHLKAEKEKSLGLVSSQAAAAPAKSKSGGAAKPKKNKPMTKLEQERRIAQLNELRQQQYRQGSGSQEPMESIEGTGNGQASGDAVPTLGGHGDTDDEESSEEE